MVFEPVCQKRHQIHGNGSPAFMDLQFKVLDLFHKLFMDIDMLFQFRLPLGGQQALFMIKVKLGVLCQVI